MQKVEQFQSVSGCDATHQLQLVYVTDNARLMQVVGNTSLESLEMLWNEGYFQQSER